MSTKAVQPKPKGKNSDKNATKRSSTGKSGAEIEDKSPKLIRGHTQREKPFANHILEEARRQRDMNTHKDHLREIKSFIDDHNTANWTHLKTKGKKMQTDEEKYSEIEKDNALLLAKMTVITRKGGDVDNKEPFPYKTSMNIYNRSTDQDKIQDENTFKVGRLRNNTNPILNHKKWEEDYTETERQMRMVSRYEYVEPKDRINTMHPKDEPEEPGLMTNRKSNAAATKRTQAEETKRSSQKGKTTRRTKGDGSGEADDGYDSQRRSGQQKSPKQAKKGIKQDGEEPRIIDETPIEPIEEEVFNDGKVVVTIIGVKDVTAMDSNGKSDPFFKVKLGTEQRTTKKVKDTLNAEFNETFTFEYKALEPREGEEEEYKANNEIVLELWDYDSLSDNDQIGKIYEFKNNKQRKQYSVEGVGNQYGQNVGVVDVEIEYTTNPEQEQVQQQQEQVQEQEQQQEQQQQQPENIKEVQPIQESQNNEDLSPKTVSITLVGVKDVTGVDSNGKSDPYIRVLFGGKEKGRTKKVADTLNAEYNETITFDYDPTAQNEKLILLELWDHDTIGDDDQIGKFEIQTDEYFNNKHKNQITFAGVKNLYGKEVGILDFELEIINKV